MSKRREIEASLRSLGEIRDILNAMKNMARMEILRLARFLLTQQRVVAGIEDAGSDFVQFHPELFLQNVPSHEVYLLLGSERGFCGDFNESLLAAFNRQVGRNKAEVVVLGSKLGAKLPGGFSPVAFLESANTVEEVDGILVRLMNTLSHLSGSHTERRMAAEPLRVTVFHHHEHGETLRVSVLDPFRERTGRSTRFAYPPRLYLEPAVFADGLVEQYLFARLHELLYSSLMVENQIRIQHLDSAVQRLDSKSVELSRRRNNLRQEEITEEIEVIMLSAGQ